MKRIVHFIFISAGFLFLAIGAAGAVLPVLPATPFLMLAAVCFARGSKKFHRWFTSTGLYLKYAEPAFMKKRMEKSAKQKSIAFLCTIFAVSFLLVPNMHAKAVIALVALFHIYYFIFKIKTVREGD